MQYILIAGPLQRIMDFESMLFTITNITTLADSFSLDLVILYHSDGKVYWYLRLLITDIRQSLEHHVV
jgi:hypothetical protein